MSNQKIPQMSGMMQVVQHTGDEVAIPIDAVKALVDNQVSLSKNMKLRIAHKGAVELAVDQGRTEPEVVAVVADQDLLDQFGIDNRPHITQAFPDGLIGQTIMVPVAADARVMPIAEVMPPEGWGEVGSSSSVDDLITPSTVMARDAIQTIVTGLPGKKNGPDMNADNYLNYSGESRDIPKDIV